MPSKVVSIVAAVALTAGLSACGNAQVVGAIAVPEVQSQNLITTPAPGETDAVTFSQKAHCKNGVVGPTSSTKQFSSTSPPSAVKDFYAALATQGQWFHRTDSADYTEQTLNYSKEQGSEYWELHISLPLSTDGRYEINLDAYNPHAHC